MPTFSVYSRSGEVCAGVATQSAKLTVTAEQFDVLLKFHEYLFSEVLRLEKYGMNFCPPSSGDDDRTSPAVLVVPLQDVGGE